MIQVDSLQFGYSKNSVLFEELNLDLKPGKIYGLLGRNGTGKSTLLKLIAGLLYPTNGSIQLKRTASKAQLIPKERPVDLLQSVFYLPEQYELPPITAKSFINIESVFYPKFDHQVFHTLLNEFEVPVNVKLNRISLGQQKKFLIAFGLACQTDYLLMDEPTNGLDIPSKSMFRKIIASTLSENQTIIISTHQIRDIEKLIDTIIVLENGQIIFNSAITEIESRLNFLKGWEKPSQENVLYYEKVMGGFVSIIPNDSDQISEIELEILFNALSQDKSTILSYFN